MNLRVDVLIQNCLLCGNVKWECPVKTWICEYGVREVMDTHLREM